ncbi:MAG: hypothetical protein LUG99_17585 [Lachnospiraceae bacterium]|nr:hypothetical protein [Lachnospiraceae bacterium]
MIKRIRSLGTFQKGVLLFMSAAILVFAVIYPAVIARVGFIYQNVVLVPARENGNTIYSGKIKGQQVAFTVYSDQSVEFQYGEQTYGPYAAREDATAVPKDSEWAEDMTGVELYDGDNLIFRGGIVRIQGGEYWLFNEDGSTEDMGNLYLTVDGAEQDESGNAVDSMEPSASVILALINGPELTHKGHWGGYLCGVLICIFTAFSVLFVDELFRLNLFFQIRHADKAEPSDWELAGRYISWTILPVAAIIVFVMGLQ